MKNKIVNSKLFVKIWKKLENSNVNGLQVVSLMTFSRNNKPNFENKCNKMLLNSEELTPKIDTNKNQIQQGSC